MGNYFTCSRNIVILFGISLLSARPLVHVAGGLVDVAIRAAHGIVKAWAVITLSVTILNAAHVGAVAVVCELDSFSVCKYDIVQDRIYLSWPSCVRRPTYRT